MADLARRLANLMRSLLWLLRRPLRRRLRGACDPAPRRGFLRLGVATAIAAVFGVARRWRSAHASTAPDPAAPSQRRWGMAIDLDSCTGCNACGIACKQENNVPVQGPETGGDAEIHWLDMLWQEPNGPDAMPQLLPFPCQHCHDAPCVKVCPVGATYKDSEGITVQVWDRCIGCRYCMVACPYGRRFYNWEEPVFDKSLAQMLNPDVATRTAGVVEKCTFCSHRLRGKREQRKLEGKPLTDEDVQTLPACASACPADAITFGDLNDPDSAVARLKESPRTFRLLEHLGTDPNVFYLKKNRRENG